MTLIDNNGENMIRRTSVKATRGQDQLNLAIFVLLTMSLFVVSGCGSFQPRSPDTGASTPSNTNGNTNRARPQIGVNLPRNIDGHFTYSPYQVVGNTTQAIWADISAKSTTDYAGKTDVELTYTVKTRETASTCSVLDVNVGLQVNIIMPEWQMPQNASSEMQEKWGVFYDNLLIHELGHRDIAVLSAKRIARWIMDVPPQSSCQKLGEMITERGDSAIQNFYDENSAYDNETDHGKTQGAVLK